MRPHTLRARSHALTATLTTAFVLTAALTLTTADPADDEPLSHVASSTPSRVVAPTAEPAVPTRSAYLARHAASQPTCVASWYGSPSDGFAGRTTASGERYNPAALTAAMWDIPLGTKVTVTSAAHPHRRVTVRINDRGPARRLNRCIDLSRAAYAMIAPLSTGLVRVHVRTAAP